MSAKDDLIKRLSIQNNAEQKKSRKDELISELLATGKGITYTEDGIKRINQKASLDELNSLIPTPTYNLKQDGAKIEEQKKEQKLKSVLSSVSNTAGVPTNRKVVTADRSTLQKMISEETAKQKVVNLKTKQPLSTENNLIEDLHYSYWKSYTNEKDFADTEIVDKYRKYGRSDESSKILSYLDKKGLTDEIKKYESYLKFEEDKADNANKAEALKTQVDSNSLKAVTKSITSVPANVIGGVVAETSNIVQQVGNEFGIGNGRINVYDGWHDMANFSINVRNAVTETIDSQVGKFLYQTGMSMADSAFVAAIGVGMQKIGISAKTSSKIGAGILGSSAANQTTRSMIEEGYTPTQAFRMGVASGIAEYLTEQIELEGLFNLGSASSKSSAFKQVIKQAFEEGKEETYSNILSRIFEAGILGVESHDYKALKEYMDNGDTEKEAFFKVLRNNVYDDVLAFAGGFISGGVMGGATTALQTTVISNKLAKNAIANGTDGLIIQQALALPTDTKAYNYASKLTDNVTISQLGKLSLLVNDYIKETKSSIIRDGVYNRAIQMGAIENQAKDIADYKATVETQGFNSLEELLTANKKATETSVGIGVLDEYLEPTNTMQWVKDINHKLAPIVTLENNMIASTVEPNKSGTTISKSDNSEVAENTPNVADEAETTQIEQKLTEPLTKDIIEKGNVDVLSDLSIAEKHIVETAKKFDSSLKVEFVESIHGEGGKKKNAKGKYVRSTNTLYIKKGLTTTQMYVEVFKHELMHRLESKKLYGSYKNYLFSDSVAFEQYVRSGLTAIQGESFDGSKKEAIEALRQWYVQQGYSYNETESEIVADFFMEVLFKGDKYRSSMVKALSDENVLPAGDYETDLKSLESLTTESQNALEEMAAKNRNLFEKLIDFIVDLKNKIFKHPQLRTLASDLDYLEQYMRDLVASADAKSTSTSNDEKYSFAGEKSQTANKSLLKQAQEMTESGIDSETVRKSTGWFKSYDGKWRYEIGDSKMKWFENPKLELHEDDDVTYRTAKLGDMIEHKELFEAYPQLKDYTVVIQPMLVGLQGSYSRSTKSIALNEILFEVKTKGYNDFLNGGRQRRINEIESTDAYKEYKRFFDDEYLDNINAEEWLKLEKEATDKFFNSELGKEYYSLVWGDLAKYNGVKYEFGFNDEGKEVLLHEIQHAVQEIESFAKGGNNNNSDYDRIAGEIESRDVASRINLATEQRKNTRPDIDRTDVVFADGSTSISFSQSIEDYPYSMQTVIKDYLSSSSKKLIDFIDKYKRDNKFSRVKISDASSKLIKDVKTILGINIDGYTNNINTNAIKHIENRHGNNGKADNSMKNTADISRVGYILENYDTIEIATKNEDEVNSSEFRDKNNNPAPMLKLTKKINGTYYVALAIPDSSYNKLWVVSAYINKKEIVTQALKASKKSNNGMSLASPISNDSISNPTENVKDNVATDSEGNKLSKGQQEFFKDSKVLDKNGNLKVMHHGTNAEFTVFEKKYSKGSNLYGRGFYFTDSESHSSQYGNSKEYYIDIQNPLSQNTKTISKEQLKKFVLEIADNEDYGIENYGYGATVDSVVSDVFGKSDFDMLQDINATCVGDLVETVKIFNEINGTKYDGFILPTETVIFDSNQAKLTTNLNPTSNPDIRFSLGSPFQQKRGNGYDGYSMSNNARSAYSNGEMPLSKWSKASIVEAVAEVNPNIDISKVTLEALKSRILKRSSWHHTSMHYNATDFYSIDEDYVHSLTQDDVDEIVREQKPTAKVVRDKSYDNAVDSVYRQIQIILASGNSKIKTENGWIKRVLNGVNLENDYISALEHIKKQDASKIEQWEKLPENHWRKEYVNLYENDFEKYVERVYSTDTLSRNSNTFKSLKEYFADSDKAQLSLGSPNQLKRYEEWNEAIEKYGVIDNTAEVPVPKSVDGEKAVSRVVNNILNHAELTEEAVIGLVDKTLMNEMSHSIFADETAVDKAEKAFKNGTAKIKWSEAIGKSMPTKGDIAIGIKFLQQAIEKNDVVEFLELSAQLAEVATRGGQLVQAFSLISKMNGLGRLMTLQKMVDTLNKNYEKQLKNKAPIKLDEKIAEQIAKSKLGENIDSLVEDALQDIANQVPVTFLDKWNSWRYLAMLFNPKTHIRNIVGNAIFTPSVRLKDIFGAMIESALVPVEQRTKSVKIKSEYKRYAEYFSKSDAVKSALDGSDKYNDQSRIMQMRRIFKNNLLEWARTTNSDLLGNEDLFFKNKHFVRALAGFLQAKKVDLNNISDEVIANAMQYAVNEAMKSTFNDANEISNTLNAMARKNLFADVAINGILPFKKTPINIVRRGVEYSPIGLLKTMSKGCYDLKKGNISLTEFIDGLGAGISGTIPFLIGGLLCQLGYITGGFGSDDEDLFKLLNGEQEYSVQFLGNSYTVDWAAPACIPFFMGAELVNSMNDGGKFTFSDIVNVGFASIDPIVNLSCLSGIQGAIEALAYASSSEEKGNVIRGFATETLDSYASQAFPTVLGSVARTFDDTKRTTYIDKNSNVPEVLQSILQNAQGKLPGLENKKTAKIDNWGREVSNGKVAERLLENFVSPGYYSKIEYDNVDNELKRLFKSTGEDVFPRKATKYVKKKGVRTDFTASEYEKFATIQGQKSFAIVEQITKHELYATMTDDQKAEAINNAYDFARTYARVQVIEDYELEKGEKKLIDKADDWLAKYFVLKARL